MKIENIIKEELSKLLKEYFDSPETQRRNKNLSPEEIRNMSNLQPYQNKFDSEFHRGKDARELHDLVRHSTYGHDERDALASAEFLYRELIKQIPEFKSYEFNKYSSGNVAHNLDLKKQVQLNNPELDDDYSAISELSIKYHVNNNDIHDYKKGRIYLFFVPHIKTTRNSFSLGDIMKKLPPLNPSTDGNVEVSDEFVDSFMTQSSKLLSGSPDDEDKYVKEKYKIYYKNLQWDSFIRILPKLRNNLHGFSKYVKNKYDINL